LWPVCLRGLAPSSNSGGCDRGNSAASPLFAFWSTACSRASCDRYVHWSYGRSRALRPPTIRQSDRLKPAPSITFKS
jgi:hypothetical protein